MAIGFVLMTTLPGHEENVRAALSDVDLVTDHWMLFGDGVRTAEIAAIDRRAELLHEP